MYNNEQNWNVKNELEIKKIFSFGNISKGDFKLILYLKISVCFIFILN